jgi:hypothetical protein
MGSFGKKGQDAGRFPAAARPLAGSAKPLPAAQPGPHVIYREGQATRPTFHGSHIEVHWPKYLAGAGFLFALGYLLHDGKRDLFGLALVPVIFALITYFAANGLRKSLNDVHKVRTSLFKSPAFGVGALAGLCYFLYSILSGPSPTDSDIAKAVAEFQNPLTPFKDGFQQRDFSAVAILIFKAAGTMALGGLVVNWIARRFFGIEADGSKA